MNKRIALFCLIISLGFTQIQAQDKSSLNIDFKNKKDIQIKDDKLKDLKTELQEAQRQKLDKTEAAK